MSALVDAGTAVLSVTFSNGGETILRSKPTRSGRRR